MGDVEEIAHQSFSDLVVEFDRACAQLRNAFVAARQQGETGPWHLYLVRDHLLSSKEGE